MFSLALSPTGDFSRSMAVEANEARDALDVVIQAANVASRERLRDVCRWFQRRDCQPGRVAATPPDRASRSVFELSNLTDLELQRKEHLVGC